MATDKSYRRPAVEPKDDQGDKSEKTPSVAGTPEKAVPEGDTVKLQFPADVSTVSVPTGVFYDGDKVSEADAEHVYDALAAHRLVHPEVA